jgi:hypothetical protein
VFESEFLTSADQSKKAYIRLISRAAEILCQFFPNQPYSGATARSLTDLIPSDFLPGEQRSSEQIAEILKVVASNSVAVSHPATAAHLHCPPLLAALAAEVVISALNQSMDSFDQAPVASIIEQKLLRRLLTEPSPPAVLSRTIWACCWRATPSFRKRGSGLPRSRDSILTLADSELFARRWPTSQ